VRVCAVALLALALLAGCGSHKEPRLGEAELEQLVLQPADLPAGYSQFDFGRQEKRDAHAGPRSDGARFGRQDGWKARYRDPDPKEPHTVESRADVFVDSNGAKEDLSAYADEFERAAVNGWRVVEVRGIGDDTRAATLLQGPRESGLRFYTVAWREGRLTGSVTLSGFDRDTPLEDVLRLARRQHQGMTR
jgi:hypothetical protein